MKRVMSKEYKAGIQEVIDWIEDVSFYDNDTKRVCIDDSDYKDKLKEWDL